jgi:hypothetical protein
MSDDKTVGQTEPPQKVIHLFGGPVPADASPDLPAPDGPVIDEDAIKYLKELLTRFEAGELVGFAMIAGQADENGEMMDMETWVSHRAFDNDFAFLGGTLILQDHIKLERGLNVIREVDRDGDE